MKTLITLALLTTLAGTAFAQSTPIGLWRTFDDVTKSERSLVRITEVDGVLVGRIEQVLDPARKDALCDKCTGDRKDKPIAGMVIMEGVRRAADKPYWDGGTILDPNEGKSYKVRLTPTADGKTLEVRGFIAFFFRNQTWQRVE